MIHILLKEGSGIKPVAVQADLVLVVGAAAAGGHAHLGERDGVQRVVELPVAVAG
jgi:hypothetical protein